MVKVDPVEFLRSEFSHDAPLERLLCLKRLQWIAAAAGPDRTRDEILPLLEGVMAEADEETHFTLAEEYRNLFPYIGGEEHLYLLLQPLGQMCILEEPVVRDMAIKTIAAMITNIKNIDQRNVLLHKHLCPLMKELSQSESFTSRISACNLIPLTFPLLEDAALHNEIPLMLVSMCVDDNPIVRRIAMTKAEAVCLHATEECIISSLYPVLEKSWKEDLEAIRLSALVAISSCCDRVPLEFAKSNVLRVGTEAVTDRSWRVRKTIACHLQPYLTTDPLAMSFMSNAILLTRDSVEEVRCNAVKSLCACLTTVSASLIVDQVLPWLPPLAEDISQPIRVSVAGVLGDLIRKLPEESASVLTQILLNLYRDESPEVRMTAVRHATTFCEVLGIASLDHAIMSGARALLEDSHPQWRVRLAAVRLVPGIARHFGHLEVEHNVGYLVLRPLKDTIHAVREEATGNLRVLAEIMGGAWTARVLLQPLLRECAASQGSDSKLSYILRITLLNCLSKVLPFVTDGCNSILPFIIEATKDPIPNVRFTAANLLEAMLTQKEVPAVTAEQIVPVLELLKLDDDKDVQYYAGNALQRISEIVKQ